MSVTPIIDEEELSRESEVVVLKFLSPILVCGEYGDSQQCHVPFEIRLRAGIRCR